MVERRKDNWIKLIEEYGLRIGDFYRYTGDSEDNGAMFRFFGLVHSADDYYYGMYGENKELQLLSCVGDIEGFQFEHVDNYCTKCKSSTMETRTEYDRFGPNDVLIDDIEYQFCLQCGVKFYSTAQREARSKKIHAACKVTEDGS